MRRAGVKVALEHTHVIPLLIRKVFMPLIKEVITTLHPTSTVPRPSMPHAGISAPLLPGLELASDIGSYSDVCGCGLFLTQTHDAGEAAETTRTNVSERCSSLTVL